MKFKSIAKTVFLFALLTSAGFVDLPLYFQTPVIT